MQFVLTEYIEGAMLEAEYDKLEDGSFVGRIPVCTGGIVFGAGLRECENELRSTLEDWVLRGLKLKHPLLIVAQIDLNVEPIHAAVGSL